MSPIKMITCVPGELRMFVPSLKKFVDAIVAELWLNEQAAIEKRRAILQQQISLWAWKKKLKREWGDPAVVSFLPPFRICQP